MRNIFIRFIWRTAVVGGLFCAVAEPAAAQRARIAGLEGDETYMGLLRQQMQLKTQEDSTASLLAGSRKQFGESSATEREALGREIVRLEGELFEIRNRMGRITAQVAAIEQDYIVNHLDDSAGGTVGGDSNRDDKAAAENRTERGGVRTLFANPFFVENLSAADVKLFSVTPKVGQEVEKINRRIAGLYEQLQTAKRQYEAATDQEVIDSLSVRAGELKEQIEQVDALMEQLWLKIYHRKLDTYSVLLDRIGTIDRLQLEQLDQEGRGVRRAEGLAGEQLAPLLATYPLQQGLALNYEITMAQALGLKRAEDSLRTEAERVSTAELAAKMTYPDIPFEPRSMIVYSPIAKVVGTGDGQVRNYTTVGDVPVLQVPKHGVYYTVQIALYTTLPKSIDVFKGMTPVMYQKLGNGQTRYVAGGFSTFAEAQAAATQMIRAGLRAAVIAFSNGKTVSAAQAKALEASFSNTTSAGSSGAAKGGGNWRVEIVPAELRLSVAAREIIAGKAPGKTIIRNSSGNEVVYVVGGFETQAEAERLAEALRDQPNVQIKVVAL